MSYVQLGAKVVTADPWQQAAAGLGKVYTIGTNVPILGTVQADIPVEQMASDALEAAKQAMSAWFVRNWMLIAGATVVVVGGTMLLRRSKHRENRNHRRNASRSHLRKEKTYYVVAWPEPRNYSAVYSSRAAAEERQKREGSGAILEVLGATVADASRRAGTVHQGWLDSR